MNIRQIKAETVDDDGETSLQDMVAAELQDSTGSVAKFVNQIITNGIDNKVSDIHIEPRLSGYIVRYRKDGMLQKVLDVPAKVETSDENYKKGIELVLKQFQDVLKSKGVEEIKTLGETFDPELHEAVSSVQDDSKGEKEIVQEYRKGYKIGHRVVRHSMVVVAN